MYPCNYPMNSNGRCSRKRSSIISCLLNLSTDTFVLQEKLSNLCQLLQSMDASDRKTSISTLPLKIRGALTKFMEDSGPVTMEKKHLGSTSIRLRAVNGKDESGAICKKYSAQLDLDSLRSYTRNMVFDLALEHQMILSDLRDQLIIENADNPDIWSPPFKVGHNGCVHGLLGKIQVIGFWRIDQKPKSSLVASCELVASHCQVCDIFDQVLASHQTSAAELGLSTFVQMRATEWAAWLTWYFPNMFCNVYLCQI